MLIAPSKRRREALSLELVLICAGLFFVSSDRFLAVNVSAFTLKPSYIFFWSAFAVIVGKYAGGRLRKFPAPFPGFIQILAALIAVNIVAAAFGISAKLGGEQLITIFGGAVLPFCAIGFGIRRRSQFDRALSALVAGALTVATYGIYQLLAPKLGLPQGLVYSGVVNGVGRISAWSYEPSFFVFFLELSLAVVIADVFAARRRFRIRPEVMAIYFIICLVLANVRAGLVSFPLLIFFVLRANSRRGRKNRQAARFVPVIVVSLLAVVVVGYPLGLNVPKYVTDRVQSIANTNESQSNAVRVGLYHFEVHQVSQRPWLGYGPSTFGLTVGNSVPAYKGAPVHSIVADNLVLQSLLDAGFISLPFLLSFLFLVYRYCRRAWDRDARMLLAATLVIFLVNGMLVSLFWDMKVWVILGLAYAGERIGAAERGATEKSASDEVASGVDAGMSGSAGSASSSSTASVRRGIMAGDS